MNTTGMYFNPATHELVPVGLSRDEKVSPGSGWVKISDDPRLGLLAVRDLLVRKGLVNDPHTVYWYGFRGSEDGREHARGLVQRPETTDAAPGPHRARASSMLFRVRDALRTLFRAPNRFA